MGADNPPADCRATCFRRRAIRAIAGIAFFLGLFSGQGRGLAQVKSPGKSNHDNADEAMQEGFVGSRNCMPCHQNIYDKFSKTGMGRSMTRVTPTQLPNLVTSATAHDEKLNLNFEVFARAGKLFQSQYATEDGGNESFRETHEIEWIMDSGAHGFSGVTTNGAYLFHSPLSFYSRIGTCGLAPSYDNGYTDFIRPLL